ncbi:MAG: hypothetical protein ACYTGG_00055 [Planctomycetota bacterium]|jgi:hypothetical protein
MTTPTAPVEPNPPPDVPSRTPIPIRGGEPPPRRGSTLPGVHRALRFLLYSALIVTAAFLVLLWQSTFAPAIVLVVVYCLLVLVSVLIHRARQAMRAHYAAAAAAEPAVAPGEPPSEREVLIAEEKVGLRIGLEILGGLVVLSVLLASILLDWRLVAIGSMVIFGLLTFLGSPFWLAIITEKVENERERLTGESKSIH